MPSLRRLPLPDHDLAFLETGAGAPLLFVHGALCDARYWTPQLDHFGKTRHAIALSLRHCWPDQWDGQDDYTATRHVEDIIAFIEALNEGPVDLVGHSRGGRLCLHAAARAPRLVRRLALYQPGGAYDATFLPPAPPPAAPASADTPLARIKAGDIESGLRLFLDGVAGDGAWAKADDLLRTILTANARTLIAMSRDASEPMTRAMAQAIEAPTLLIGGEGIPVGFTRVLDALESFIPNVRRARIASSSHFANIEAPEVFNRALGEFLTSQTNA